MTPPSTSSSTPHHRLHLPSPPSPRLLLHLTIFTTSATLLLMLLLWTPASAIIAVQVEATERCGDPVCRDTIDDLQERLHMVLREHEGLLNDNERLEDELRSLSVGLAEEKRARDGAHDAMQDYFKEIKHLKDQLGFKSFSTPTGEEGEEEPFCDKNSQKCPEGR